MRSIGDLNRRRWKTRIELANAIFDYLAIFHNRQRRHSALGMRTPIEFGAGPKFPNKDTARSDTWVRKQPLKFQESPAPGVPVGPSATHGPTHTLNVGPECNARVMSATVTSVSVEARPGARLEVLFEELSELTGQRNAIDGRIVEIVAEVERDELWGATGARSLAALVTWKTGVSPGNAETIATVAHRLESFPRCAQGMREGRFSLDQVGVIAQRAGEVSDEHYAQLAGVATVNQLRTAVKLN